MRYHSDEFLDIKDSECVIIVVMQSTSGPVGSVVAFIWLSFHSESNLSELGMLDLISIVITEANTSTTEFDNRAGKNKCYAVSNYTVTIWGNEAHYEHLFSLYTGTLLAERSQE